MFFNRILSKFFAVRNSQQNSGRKVIVDAVGVIPNPSLVPGFWDDDLIWADVQTWEDQGAVGTVP